MVRRAAHRRARRRRRGPFPGDRGGRRVPRRRRGRPARRAHRRACAPAATPTSTIARIPLTGVSEFPNIAEPPPAPRPPPAPPADGRQPGAAPLGRAVRSAARRASTTTPPATAPTDGVPRHLGHAGRLHRQGDVRQELLRGRRHRRPSTGPRRRVRALRRRASPASARATPCTPSTSTPPSAALDGRRRRPGRTSPGATRSSPGGDALDGALTGAARPARTIAETSRTSPGAMRRMPARASFDSRTGAAAVPRPTAPAATRSSPWVDARGHRRRSPSTPPPTRRPRLPRHLPGHRPVPARPVPDDVRQPAVDDPPVRRVLHGRGVQRLLPAQPRGRPEGPVGRVRPRHPPGLRQRPPAGRRRRRHGRRGDRLDPRHAPAVRPHPARPDERVDDDERRGAAGAGALRRGGRGAGRAPEQLAGTIQNDILKEFMVRNTYIYPPGPSMRIISDIFAFTSREMPKFNSISISGYHMQEAGATADLELGYTLADGVEYIRAGLAAGLTIDAFAPRLSFFWAIGMNFFMEVAKLRAARLLWAEARASSSSRRATSRCRCAPTRRRRAGRSPRRTCSTTWCARASRRWPRRRATPSRCTPTRSTRRSRCPTDFSARIARNTQLFLQQESGTCRVIDPWGGSYYVERLTHELATRAWAHIAEVEAAGGMTEAIEAGIPKLRIEEAAARTQARIDSGRQPVDRRQHVPPRRRRRHRRAQGRQHRRCGPSRSPSSSGCAPSATRRPCDEALDRAHRRRAADRRRHAGRRPRPQPARAGDRRRPGAGHRSARSAPRSRRCSAATPRRSVRSAACTATRSASPPAIAQGAGARRPVRGRRGPPAAHPRRQDGPGRPRPRPEGDRHRVRRPRLRRRRRPAVPDARRGRPPGGRGRRARRRRVDARRRPPHARARAAQARSPRSAATTS